jgi:acyl-CoA hydrolase
MAALEQLEVVSPVHHGDVVRFEGELINIGRSSLTLQVNLDGRGTARCCVD